VRRIIPARVYEFRLEERIPENHLLLGSTGSSWSRSPTCTSSCKRIIARLLGLRFDPQLIIRMLVTGY
jgi:hypothetical protein